MFNHLTTSLSMLTTCTQATGTQVITCSLYVMALCCCCCCCCYYHQASTQDWQIYQLRLRLRSSIDDRNLASKLLKLFRTLLLLLLLLLLQDRKCFLMCSRQLSQAAVHWLFKLLHPAYQRPIRNRH